MARRPDYLVTEYTVVTIEPTEPPKPEGGIGWLLLLLVAIGVVLLFAFGH
ncbi:hypothetical protein [Acidisphaera sp. S103]|nr:hypothetical protein [Acidisphaera sp. S103]